MIPTKLKKKTGEIKDNVTTDMKVIRTVKMAKRLRRSYRTNA